MDKLLSLLKSRKFWASVIALVLIFFGDRAGISGDQLTQAVYVLISYVLGVGLSDIRKG